MTFIELPLQPVIQPKHDTLCYWTLDGTQRILGWRSRPVDYDQAWPCWDVVLQNIKEGGYWIFTAADEPRRDFRAQYLQIPPKEDRP